MVRRYARGAARRADILVAAFDVLNRNGLRKTSLREIARELDLEPAHILYYFDSREALLQEVIREWDARNTIEPDDIRDALDFSWFIDAARRNVEQRGMVQAYLGFASEASDVEHPSHEFFRARFASLRMAIVTVLVNLQSRGRITADLDMARLARQIMALSDGLDLQWLVDPNVDLPTELEIGIECILSTCRAH